MGFAKLLVELVAATLFTQSAAVCKKEIVDVFPLWGAGDGWLTARIFNIYGGEGSAYNETISQKNHRRSILYYTPGVTPLRRRGNQFDPSTGCFNGVAYDTVSRPDKKDFAGIELGIQHTKYNKWYDDISHHDEGYDKKTPASTFAILRAITRERTHKGLVNVVAWLHRTPQFGSSDLDLSKIDGCATVQLPSLKQLSDELKKRGDGKLIWMRSNEDVDFSGITGFDNMEVLDTIDMLLPKATRLQAMRNALPFRRGHIADVEVVIEGNSNVAGWIDPFTQASWLKDGSELMLNQHWSVTFTQDFKDFQCYIPASDVGHLTVDFDVASAALEDTRGDAMAHAMAMSVLKLGDDRQNRGPIVLFVSSNHLPKWSNSDEWRPTASCTEGLSPASSRFAEMVERYNALVYVGAVNEKQVDGWIDNLKFLDPGRIIVGTETDFDIIDAKVTEKLGNHLASYKTAYTAVVLAGPGYNKNFINTAWGRGFAGEKTAYGFMTTGFDKDGVATDSCWLNRGQRDGMPFQLHWYLTTGSMSSEVDTTAIDNPMTYAIAKASVEGPVSEVFYIKTNRKPFFSDQSAGRDFSDVQCSDHISPTKEEFEDILKGGYVTYVVETADEDVAAAWKNVTGITVNDGSPGRAFPHAWTHYIIDQSADGEFLGDVLTRRLYTATSRLSIVGDWTENDHPACFVSGLRRAGGHKGVYLANIGEWGGDHFAANDLDWSGSRRGPEYGLYSTLLTLQQPVPNGAYGPPTVNFWVEKKPNFDEECLGPKALTCVDVTRICVQDVVNVAGAAAKNIKKLNFVGPEADAWKELFASDLAPIAVDAFTPSEQDSIIDSLENFMCGTDDTVSEFRYPTFLKDTTTPPPAATKADDEGGDHQSIFLGAFIAA